MKRFDNNKSLFIIFTSIILFFNISTSLYDLFYLDKKEDNQSENNKNISSECKDYKLKRLSGYKYAMPLMFVDNTCQSEKLSSLKNELNNLFNKYKESGVLISASLYLKDYNSNGWIAINENETYSPASLLKVPALITLLKMSEKNPGFLNKKIVFNKHYDVQIDPKYLSKSIKFGETYTVKELMSYMIKYSDNNATLLLNELMDVKNQIVSLELSKMPVTDNDLQNVAKFENLRRLNLNFTNITGDGLATLASLKHLTRLSLSGTKVNYPDLKQTLVDFENLNTISLWKTEVTADEINQLQTEYKNIQFLVGLKDDGSNPIKLNTPKLKHKSVVFDDSIQLQLFHPVKGVEIRFTTDGGEPDSTASIFNGTTILKESTTIKARAHKSGWLSSDAVTLHVYRSYYKPDSIMLLSKLNRVHPANGAQTFFDHQLGTFNANSPAWANNWAGFLKNDMELLLEYKTPKEISSIAMNTLIETETSIFPPATIEIWGGPSIDKIHLITRMNPEYPKDYRKPFIELIECKVPKRKVSYLKIIARPLRKLPSWHKNKNNPALLLVDEVLIN